MTTTVPNPTSFSDLTGTYALDPAHSRIGFVARHAMVTKVRGAFNDVEAVAHLDGDDISRSSVKVTIAAKSIDTRQAQRDEHLRSNDFLAMDEFPTLTFTSTAVRRTGDSQFEVDGDLTIRGTTRQVALPLSYEGSAKDPYGNTRVGFEGSLVINRKDFGITYNAVLETGGVLISDKVTLELEVSLVKTA